MHQNVKKYVLCKFPRLFFQGGVAWTTDVFVVTLLLFQARVVDLKYLDHVFNHFDFKYLPHLNPLSPDNPIRQPSVTF